MSFVDFFTGTPHLTERIFNDLTIGELMICRRVCQSWKGAAECNIQRLDSLAIFSEKGRDEVITFYLDFSYDLCHHVIPWSNKVKLKKSSLSEIEVDAIARLCPSLKVIAF